MEPDKKFRAARVTILGTIGFFLGFVVLRSVPEVIRYVKISRF